MPANLHRIVQHSFLAGVLDLEMMGRQDMQRYTSGASKLDNFLIHRRGTISKRPGTDFLNTVTDYIGATASSDGNFRLVPFCYTEDLGFVILFAEGKARAFPTKSGSTYSNIPVYAQNCSFFNADQLREFDYCQCGDVLFLAHRTHPPCKLEHVDNGDGTHTFTLKPMDFAEHTRDLPSIRSAIVTKLSVSNGGGIVTERYKATAVYDGAETIPSEPYFGFATNDTVHHENAQSTSGTTDGLDDFVPTTKFQSDSTSYHSPWTESQTIRLAVKVPTRTDPDGNTTEPDQIRIYKKQGGTYGLIGTISDEDYNASSETISSTDAQGTTVAFGYTQASRKNCSGGTAITFDTNEPSLFQSLSEVPKFGINRAGWTINLNSVDIPASESLKGFRINLANAARDASVTIHPGCINYEFTPETSTNARNASVTFFYVPSGVKVWHACLASSSETKHGPTRSVNVQGAQNTGNSVSKTLTQLSNESSTDFDNRWRAALVEFANSIDAADSVTMHLHTYTTTTPNAGAYNEIFIWGNVATGGSAVTSAYVNLISSEAIATDSSQTSDDQSDVQTWQDTQKAKDGNRTIFFTDRNFTPDLSLTPPAKFEGMQSDGDYPGCVCLHQQRLVWASTKNDPRRIWLSHIGDFYTYAAHDTLTDDDPIDFQMSASLFPAVRHMVELKRLIVFNGASEWIVSSASQSSGITYATIQAIQHSAIGADKNLKPLLCNNVLIFAERTGQAVRAYSYQLEDDGYGGEDISIFARSILSTRKIVSWAFQQHPNSTCWCALSDGTLASLTFNREQNTIAWATHSLGNGGKALAVAPSGALISAYDGAPAESEIFILARYGNDVRMERLRPECPSPVSDTSPASYPFASALCLDSLRTVASGSSAPANTTIVNASTGEVLDLDDTTVTRLCGYPFSASFTSVFPHAAERTGQSHLDIKSIQTAYLRTIASSGGKVWAQGADPDHASALVETVPTLTTVSSVRRVNLPSTTEVVPLETTNTRDGRINVSADASSPWPFTLSLLEFDLNAEYNERQ